MIPDIYDFDDEQLAAIAQVECLRRMREYQRSWRDHYRSGGNGHHLTDEGLPKVDDVESGAVREY